MNRYVFDVEANGLLEDNPTIIWYAVVRDIEKLTEWHYSDYCKTARPMDELPQRLAEADELIGQNIIGYDLIVIKRILGWESPVTQKKIDTMLMSQSLDQRRFTYEGHSLDRWGQHFNFPKLEIEDGAWLKWDDRYPERCARDVEINTRQYFYLMKEMKEKAKYQPLQKLALAAEHFTAEFFAEANERGWPFDILGAKRLLEQMDRDLKDIELELEPQMPIWIKPKDSIGKVGTKDYIGKELKPKYVKTGGYNSHTCRYFDLQPKDALVDSPLLTPDRPFTLIEYERGELSKTEHVKRWITTLGWVPLQYNTKRVGKYNVQTSPKLCEASLEAIGPIGEYINEYNSTSSRASILRNWIAGVDANGNLHGDVRVIGTPTFRCRHQVITNVPGADRKWGPEVRSLFICKPGYVIVGADSSGNQARGLCHYVQNDEFTKRYLSDDLHDQNAKILGCTRKVAKTFIYAYLFGASDSKLGLYLTNRPDPTAGARARATFEASLPGLGDLIDHLTNVYEQTKKQIRSQHPRREYNQGYIPDAAGRRVYSDSPHKLLNYLLQSLEGLTCKAALMYTVKKFREEKIPYRPLIHYHDEYEVMVEAKYSKRVAELMEEGFREAPKWFGVQIMDGKAKVGLNWYEVH